MLVTDRKNLCGKFLTKESKKKKEFLLIIIVYKNIGG